MGETKSKTGPKKGFKRTADMKKTGPRYDHDMNQEVFIGTCKGCIYWAPNEKFCAYLLDHDCSRPNPPPTKENPECASKRPGQRRIYVVHPHFYDDI